VLMLCCDVLFLCCLFCRANSVFQGSDTSHDFAKARSDHQYRQCCGMWWQCGTVGE
jgi:hypothetical protein